MHTENRVHTHKTRASGQLRVYAISGPPNGPAPTLILHGKQPNSDHDDGLTHPSTQSTFCENVNVVLLNRLEITTDNRLTHDLDENDGNVLVFS